MAESDVPAAAAKDALGFLTKKVGPLPVGVWLLMAAAVLLYLERKKAATAAGTASAVPNQQTDPAGNIGTIDPATGYVYGTPEDLAALTANNAGSTSGGTSAGGSSTSGGQTYADNNAWGIAAVNFLVADGIDPTTANQAVQQYLSSQTLTTQQQADVNLAIIGIGPPPDLPGPTTGNPSSVTTPPATTTGTGTGTQSGQTAVPNVVGRTDLDTAEGIITAAGFKAAAAGDSGVGNKGKVTAQSPAAGATAAQGSTVTITYTVTGATGSSGSGGSTSRGVTAAVPTGLTVSSKASTSLAVKWNRSANATGYHVLCTDMATKKVTNQFDVSSGTLTATCGGLTAGHSYVIDVWAAPPTTYTGAHAEVSTTLPK
jgi:hypothetical protein